MRIRINKSMIVWLTATDKTALLPTYTAIKSIVSWAQCPSRTAVVALRHGPKTRPCSILTHMGQLTSCKPGFEANSQSATCADALGRKGRIWHQALLKGHGVPLHRNKAGHLSLAEGLVHWPSSGEGSSMLRAAFQASLHNPLPDVATEQAIQPAEVKNF